MKYISLFLLAYLPLISTAQKYITQSGTTEFKASVQAFEPVEATNQSTTAVLNTANGEVAALLFIKAFHFKVALMEEHFNENYMETDAYPKASFKGSLKHFDLGKLSDVPKDYPLQGELTIRGITQPIETMARLYKDGDKIIVRTTFKVSPNDFGIDIPKIVEEKIAKEINITARYELAEKI